MPLVLLGNLQLVGDVIRRDEQRGGEERVEAEENSVSRRKISATNLEMKGMGVVADKVLGVLREAKGVHFFKAR